MELLLAVFNKIPIFQVQFCFAFFFFFNLKSCCYSVIGKWLNIVLGVMETTHKKALFETVPTTGTE